LIGFISRNIILVAGPRHLIVHMMELDDDAAVSISV
jgi:hypothetical protein